MFSDEKLENFLKAGKIAAKVVRYAEQLVKSGHRDVYNLCEKIEQKIIELGAFPAFPCNICINDVAAHFSPYPTDQILLPERGVVKIDIGVRINGYIVDTAFSIPLSDEFERLVEWTKLALERAIRAIKPRIRASEIGAIIENTAKEGGFKPIRNLSGHLIKEYRLHAGKSIPNVQSFFSDRILEGEIYAIEPFLTLSDASGSVKSTKTRRIFSLSKIKRPKDKRLEHLYKEILRRFRMLPFSPRWLAKSNKFENVVEKIISLEREGIIHSYPVLVEKLGGIVAQFEHTIVVTKDGALVLTED